MYTNSPETPAPNQEENVQEVQEQVNSPVTPEEPNVTNELVTSNLDNNDVALLGMSDEEFLKQEEESFNSTLTEQQQTVATDVQQPNELPASDNTVENTEPENNTPQVFSPEDFVKAVTSEFTANGRTMRVESPEDVIRLMQMGVNYGKKMEALKPQMGLLRTLQQHGLTDPEKLKHLIDIANHDKSAIAHLLKSADIDTYDLPDLDETPYTPQATVMSNEMAELDAIFQDVRSLPHGSDLLDQLVNPKVWDDASVDFFGENPEAIYQLYQDYSSGLYNQVMSRIDLDRTMGRIPQSWLDEPLVKLYELVAGQLSNANATGSQQNQAPLQAPKVVGTNIQTQQITQPVSNAPLAASTQTVKNGNNVLVEIPDFLNMSDAQFEAWERSTQGLNF